MALQMGNDERMVIRQLARRRLVGAVVLLSLAAIVLPLVLDSGPRPVPVAPAVRHAGQVAVTLQKPGSGPAATAVATTSAPTGSPVPGHAVSVAPMPASMPAASQAGTARERLTEGAQTTAKVTPPVEQAAQTAVPASHRPAVSAQEKTVVAASAAVPVHGSESRQHHAGKPASESAARTPVAAKTAGHDKSFAVQLGVFSHVSNAEDLCKRVKAQGLTCHSEQMPSGAHRLRVGPYASRKEAEQVLVRLKLADLSGQIVPVSP